MSDTNSLSYRPEVDGLRAVAVCAVIANHFNHSLLLGGFLGVDIFFVISWYVITRSLIGREYRGLGDMLAHFYARRVKRILPALIACVVITAIVGSLFVNPASPDYRTSLTTGLFSLFGLSNLYLFKQAVDYFGSSATLNLFTHTWSLAVEEQFYVLFPALFWYFGFGTLKTTSRNKFIFVMSLLSALSLALFVGMHLLSVSRAYYMFPPRFWELGIGCLVALAPANALTRHGSTWSWSATGVLLIALALPPELQLYTTIAAVIASGVLIMTLQQKHPIYRLLASRLMVSIGLISYSLYLWHWSILALSRWTIGIHLWSAPIQLLTMFGLAALSYVLIERPLRQANWSRFRLGTIAYGLAAATCAAVLVLMLRSGVGEKLYTGAPADMAAKGAESLFDGKRLSGIVQWRARDCILSSDMEVGKKIDLNHCTLGGQLPNAPRFLVIGNSYSAAELEMYGAVPDAALGSISVTSTWGASATPSLENKSAWSKANTYYWNEVIPLLVAQLKEGDVLVMINDLSDLAPVTNTRSNQEKLDTLKGDLTHLAESLDAKGVKIIFQAGTPFLRDAQCPPDAALNQWFNFGQNTPCSYHTRTYTISRLAALNDTLIQVQRENANFFILDLMPVLCPEDICRFQDRNGVFLYRDIFSHPSLEAGALSHSAFLAVAKRATAAPVPTS
ncbi:MAG: acyltransferase family protein [Brevundimonas sp.]|nr:acyltransferase family protein [Brevundimonas sp.]